MIYCPEEKRRLGVSPWTLSRLNQYCRFSYGSTYLGWYVWETPALHLFNLPIEH
jgi:hypothetical protein